METNQSPMKTHTTTNQTETTATKPEHTPTGSCIEWVGSIDGDGYGRVQSGGKSKLAHRVAYERKNGKIPDGMVIDHLCRNRACVNLDHMEVVTPVENTMRGFNPMAVNARKLTCSKGHPLDETDKRGHRQCKTCARARWREYRRRKIADGTWNYR